MAFSGVMLLLYASMIHFQLANSADISFNQPNLSSCAQWNPNGITFLNDSKPLFTPNTIFIDKNNTILVTSTNNPSIYEWRNNSTNRTTLILNGLDGQKALFVSTKGDIYINSGVNGRIDKWIATTNTTETIVYFGDSCFNIFIDRNDTLYCSMPQRHQVVTKSLHSNSNITTVVAGNGIKGSATNMLNFPTGIFINTNFDLYVSDAGNKRVLLFHPGDINGIIVAGSHDTIMLSYPTGVVLDANDHIYIVDSLGNRILGSGPYGFRCVAGCSETSSSLSNGLYYPTNIAFDTYGNIYVTDRGHFRVQKFLLSSNPSTCEDIPSVIVSKYSSAITSNSQKYGGKDCLMLDYYYEALQINVSTSGNYTLQSNISINLYGYLYQRYFNPYDPKLNLLSMNEDGDRDNQFKITSYLQANITYVLVVTMVDKETIGAFSVLVSGPNNVVFNRINLQSTYTSKLTEHSQVYTPVQGQGNHYYETIQMRVEQNDFYTFDSINSILLYAYIYQKHFDASYPQANLLAHSNSSCGSNPFGFGAYLQANVTYMLVVATSYPNIQGNFTLVVSGPHNITLNRIAYNTTQPSTTTKSQSTTQSSTTTKPQSTTRPSTTTTSQSTTQRRTTTTSKTTLIKPQIFITIIVIGFIQIVV